MVAQFGSADGPIFLLSLKAGGTGPALLYPAYQHLRSEATLQAGIAAGTTNPDDANIEFTGDYGDLLGALTDPLRFPAIRAALQSGLSDQADDGDEDFEFGPSRILDGIELLMTTDQARNVADRTD